MQNQSQLDQAKKSIWMAGLLLGLLLGAWVFETVLASVFIARVEEDCHLLYQILIPYLVSSLVSCAGVGMVLALLKFKGERIQMLAKALLLFGILARVVLLIELMVKGKRVFGMCYMDRSFRVLLNLMNMGSIGMLASLYWIMQQILKLS